MTLPNTFSMTSGTSGCEDHSLVKVDKLPLHFSEANYEMLLSDMSNGRGETVATLAGILGCEKTAFVSSLQHNFANLSQAQNGIELYDMISAGSYCQVQ